MDFILQFIKGSTNIFERFKKFEWRINPENRIFKKAF
jgi:hypothetical protein